MLPLDTCMSRVSRHLLPRSRHSQIMDRMEWVQSNNMIPWWIHVVMYCMDGYTCREYAVRTLYYMRGTAEDTTSCYHVERGTPSLHHYQHSVSEGMQKDGVDVLVDGYTCRVPTA